eukprot:TRINITY_DN743_c1_g2_i1.p2 TRINITY_DN743_c1_g2~~TRINITY_DN743_c1_g2_i1.p2  ORF type:complete len:882 (+),score=296.14 TRINITY_DN743_c1_g2_i1:6294-8939(+)
MIAGRSVETMNVLCAISAQCLPGCHEGLRTLAHLVGGEAGRVQRRPQAEAGGTGRAEHRHAVGGDAAHRQQCDLARDHRAPGLHHLRTQLFGGEHLEDVGTIVQGGKGFGDSGHARGAVEACLAGGADHGTVAVGHDDQFAAGVLDLLHLGRLEHGTGADDAVGRQALAQDGDAGQRFGRVERDFDDAETGFVERRADGLGLVVAHAAQDGDHAGLLQGVVESLGVGRHVLFRSALSQWPQATSPAWRASVHRPVSVASVASLTGPRPQSSSARRQRRHRPGSPMRMMACCGSGCSALSAAISWPISRPERQSGCAVAGSSPVRPRVRLLKMLESTPAWPCALCATRAPRMKAASSALSGFCMVRPRMVWAHSAPQTSPVMKVSKCWMRAPVTRTHFECVPGRPIRSSSSRCFWSAPTTWVSSPRITLGRVETCSRPGTIHSGRPRPVSTSVSWRAMRSGASGTVRQGASRQPCLLPTMPAAISGACGAACIQSPQAFSSAARQGACGSSPWATAGRFMMPQGWARRSTTWPLASKRQQRREEVPQSRAIRAQSCLWSGFIVMVVPASARQAGVLGGGLRQFLGDLADREAGQQHHVLAGGQVDQAGAVGQVEGVDRMGDWFQAEIRQAVRAEHQDIAAAVGGVHLQAQATGRILDHGQAIPAFEAVVDQAALQGSGAVVVPAGRQRAGEAGGNAIRAGEPHAARSELQARLGITQEVGMQAQAEGQGLLAGVGHAQLDLQRVLAQGQRLASAVDIRIAVAAVRIQLQRHAVLGLGRDAPGLAPAVAVDGIGFAGTVGLQRVVPAIDLEATTGDAVGPGQQREARGRIEGGRIGAPGAQQRQPLLLALPLPSGQRAAQCGQHMQALAPGLQGMDRRQPLGA